MDNLQIKLVRKVFKYVLTLDGFIIGVGCHQWILDKKIPDKITVYVKIDMIEPMRKLFKSDLEVELIKNLGGGMENLLIIKNKYSINQSSLDH